MQKLETCGLVEVVSGGILLRRFDVNRIQRESPQSIQNTLEQLLPYALSPIPWENLHLFNLGIPPNTCVEPGLLGLEPV